jgi:hypothetical protein
MTVRSTDLTAPVEPLARTMSGWRSTVASVPLPLAQAVLITSLLYLFLGVWHRDIRVPLAFAHDALWYLMQSKGTVDNGWWWWNPRLGAPFGLDALAYPSNSTVDQAFVWVVSRFVPHAIATVNLTWALLVVFSGLTATWCMRMLGVSSAGAFVAGTLFAFSPYALYRNIEHFALVIYLVPFACAAALRLASGDPHQTWGRAGRAIVFAGCALLGFDYVYYAFFGSFCIAAGSLIGYVARRDRRLLVTGALCLSIVAGSTLVNLAPSFYSWHTNGRPLLLRDKTVAQSEMFGLKIRQLVSPVYPHRFGPFRRWVEAEGAARFPNDNENWSSRLGLIGTLGFLGLLALLFVPETKRSRPMALLRGASRLTLAALLLATIGGFGTVFNLLVSPDIRAYNRISPFIAFFSLFAVVVTIDRLLTSQRARITAAAAILVIGISDQGQPTRTLNQRYGDIAAEISSLKAAVETIERVLPAGAMVLQLPFRPYMSESDLGRMKQYDHFKPYLVSRHLRFSYPALSNEQVRWQEAAARLDVRILASRLSAQGFSAVLIDRYGYEDEGNAVTTALLRVVEDTRVILKADRFLAVDITGLHNMVADAGAMEPVPLTLSLPPCSGQSLMRIDQIGSTYGPFSNAGAQIPASQDFKVDGWAVDHAQRVAAAGVDVMIDKTMYPSTYGVNRNDVAEYFRRPSYRDTGFTATIPANALPAGEHWLSVRAVASNGACYYESPAVRLAVN